MPIYLPVFLASSGDHTLKGADLRRAQVPFLTCWSLPGMNANFWTFVIVGSVLKKANKCLFGSFLDCCYVSGVANTLHTCTQTQIHSCVERVRLGTLV
uniref:Uncharacterized protein n=1 Tax=Rhipicephalus zambeziensis TaxID=60191 RepID=A0A224YLQ6_9ACAR